MSSKEKLNLIFINIVFDFNLDFFVSFINDVKNHVNLPTYISNFM